jgi:hypothetical protein
MALLLFIVTFQALIGQCITTRDDVPIVERTILKERPVSHRGKDRRLGFGI